MRRLLAVVCLMSLGSASLAEDGAVYRWTDEKGRIHFGQVPPQGHRYEEVTPRGARKTRPSAPTGLSGNVEGFLEQAEREQAAEDRAEAEARQKQALADRNCAEARKQLRFLEDRSGHRLAVLHEDGNYGRMDADEYQKRLGEARSAIDTHCEKP